MSSTEASPCFVTPADKLEPHKYWLRVRAVYPQLARTMLFWLSHPIGTPALERDFSGMTMVLRDSRRGRLRWPNFRVAVLVHCHAKALRAKLANAVTK